MVTGLSPSSGLSTGDSTVEITGTGFDGPPRSTSPRPVTGVGDPRGQRHHDLGHHPAGFRCRGRDRRPRRGQVQLISAADCPPHLCCRANRHRPEPAQRSRGWRQYLADHRYRLPPVPLRSTSASTAATSLFVNDDTLIEVISPAGTGTVDVVRHPSRYFAYSRLRISSLIVVVPIVTGISPSSGSGGRRHSCNDHRTGFIRAAERSTSAPRRRRASSWSTTLRSRPTAPPNSTVNVTVITQASRHLADLAADQFNHTVVAADRQQASARPASWVAGRRCSVVTITGTGFTGATAGSIGTTAATGSSPATPRSWPIAPLEPPTST